MKDDNKADMAVRIAKSIAIVAGICSSDDDDEFDSRGFIDGFTGKLKKKLDEYLEGIHAGDTMNGDLRVPCVFFPEKYSGEYTAGNYIGKFDIAYNYDCEPDGLQFCIHVSLQSLGGDFDKELYGDQSCYTVHVRSFSGERAVLNKTANAFMLSNIGDYSILSLLKGEAVIDEYGIDVPGSDVDLGEIGQSNHDFIFDELKDMADDMKKKISSWVDQNKIVSKMWFDFGNMVNKNENAKKGIDVPMD